MKHTTEMCSVLTLSVLLAAWPVASSAESAMAAPVPDQQAPVAIPQPFTWALGGESKQVLYQSFTVGLNGRLVELRLPIGCESGEVILQIFDANPDGLPLAGAAPRLTRNFAADSFPSVVLDDFHPIPLGSSIGVAAGERLVFVLSNPTGSCGIGGSAAGDIYLGGTGHGDDTTDPFAPVPLNISPGNPDDLPFQTFVRLTGLTPSALSELQDAGVDKYVGKFEPAVSEPIADGWIKHRFDPAGGDGPICIAGTEYSVFTKAGNPAKLLIMLQGGGACWQESYNCNILSESQEPPAPPVGIWDEANPDNPVGDWSVVYMPYCDGSVFSGDNDVLDLNWQLFLEAALGLPAGTGPVVRFHRGLRNVTVGIDLAKAMFPRARKILLTGSSAGGVGAAAFAPFLARMAFGGTPDLMVFNDGGPVAINLADTAAITARANDWQFGQFYPTSCIACSDVGQGTEIIKWRLGRDRTIREAFYSTDGDFTNRFFLDLLPPEPRQVYRDLIVDEHGQINSLYPDRYKRFIRSGDVSHTAIQTPLLYSGEANGLPLFKWVDDFLIPRPSWVDVVEDFIPGP